MPHFGDIVDNRIESLSKPLEGIKYPSPLSRINGENQKSEESLETPTLYKKTRQSQDIQGESKSPREVLHSVTSKRYVAPLSDYDLAISPNMVDMAATNTVRKSKSLSFKRTADEAFNRTLTPQRKISYKLVEISVEEQIQMKKDEGRKKKGNRKKGSSVMVGNLKRHDTQKKENEVSFIDTSSSEDISSTVWFSCSICLKAKKKNHFSPVQISGDASTRICLVCYQRTPIIIMCSICRFQKDKYCYSKNGRKKKRCRDCEEAMLEKFQNAIITCCICQVKKHKSCYPKSRCRDCIETICKEETDAENCKKGRRYIEAVEAIGDKNSELEGKIEILSRMQKALEDQLNAKYQENDTSMENEKMGVLSIEDQTKEPSKKHR